MTSITPFLWINAPADEVRQYYMSIFGKDAELIGADENLDDSPGGPVHIFSLQLKGQIFRIMCTGPHDPFTDAVSFQLDCKDQAEIDHFWDSFTQEGQESQCGWCQDKYGVRWQVLPENFSDLVASKEAMDAMMEMKKIVIAELRGSADS